MAFELSNLLVARGGYNTGASETAIVIHTYQSSVDDISAINSAGYFPAFLGRDNEVVKAGDQLVVKGSDDTDIFELVTVDPVTLKQSFVPGTVAGPGSSTNDALARWIGTGGNLLNDSGVILDSSDNMTIPASGSLKTDTINETTSANGVDIDGVIVKDDSISMTPQASNPGDATTVWIDSATGNLTRGAVDLEDKIATITSSTDTAIPRWDGTTGDALLDSGVLIDGSDNVTVPAGSEIKVDTINETTAANGINIDGVIAKDDSLSMSAQASNPGDATTIWINSSNGHLFRGAVDTEDQIPTVGSSTDTAIAKWNGTSGDALADTGVLIDGSDNVTIPAGSALSADTINETTAANGINADGVLLKDDSVSLTAQASNPGAADTLWINTSNGHLFRGSVDVEDTGGDVSGPFSSTDTAISKWNGVLGDTLADTGVLIDGSDNVTIPASSALNTDSINETTAANGVDVDGVLLKDDSVSLTAQASNPGAADTLWINSSNGHLFRGAVDVEDTGGDVSGPGSSTDTAVVRWDGATGDALLNSAVLIDASDNMSFPAASAISVNTINEVTTNNGVNIDGVLLKDDGVFADGVLSTFGNSTTLQDLTLHMQGRQNLNFFIEADTDNTTETHVPTMALTQDGNLTLANIGIDSVNKLYLECGSTVATDMEFKTGGITTGAATGTIPTFDDTAPTVAFTLRGSDQVGVFSAGLELPTTGGTATTLDFYEELNSSFTTTVGSAIPSASVDFRIIRVGKNVSITLTGMPDQTPSSPATITFTAAIAARFRPVAIMRGTMIVQNDNVQQTGSWQMDTSGNLTIYGDDAQGNFGNSSTAGVDNFTMVWNINT